MSQRRQRQNNSTNNGVSHEVATNGDNNGVAQGHNHVPKTTSFKEDVAALTFVVGAIYLCYLGYGILHEKIYSQRYGPNNLQYNHSLFLVLVQCIVNGLLSLIVMTFQKQPQNLVPLRSYLMIGGSYIGAMLSSNVALQYVSFPLQSLAKSCKLIPVMLMRIVILRKSYPLSEYINVLLTTIGITVFMLFQGGKHGTATNSMFGLVLLFISLALDGFTGPTQEKLIENYKPTIYQMMFWMNFWSVLMITIGLVVIGDLIPSIEFVTEFPELIPTITIFSLLSAVGQIVILVCVFRFDSLVLVTITTTRKFFTILCSVLWFGHQLRIEQWIGVFLVFLGLGLNIYYKYLDRLKAEKSKGKDKDKQQDSDQSKGKDGGKRNQKDKEKINS